MKKITVLLIFLVLCMTLSFAQKFEEVSDEVGYTIYSNAGKMYLIVFSWKFSSDEKIVPVMKDMFKEEFSIFVKPMLDVDLFLIGMQIAGAGQEVVITFGKEKQIWYVWELSKI